MRGSDVIMSLTGFARHLQVSRETIVRRWQEAIGRAAAEVPSAQGLPEQQLRDHLPTLLDEIAGAVGGAAVAGVEAGGREHGRQRWGSGYDISEALRELAVLRQTLLDALDEYALGSPGLAHAEQMEAMRRLLDVIDRSAQAAAAQFHAEALGARRLLEAELEAASEQKDRFLALLSHELRNPLGPILTAVQLLEFTESDDPRLRRAREIIERQIRYQVRLIDDLLDVTRIARGKIALRLEAHDLSVVVAHAVESCLPAIEAKGQQLYLELAAGPLTVDADPVRLEQILINLLSNATRYTDPGGAIWLSTVAEDGHAVVRVRDNGSGIAPEMLPRVFDLFVQAEAPRGRDSGGLGIGLTLVKNLVELHSGIVEAHSSGPGTGSEFVVRLPLVDAAAAAAPAGGSLLKPAGRRRVVLVEDHADSRTMLAELLELLGHQVVAVPDGAEALRLAAEALPEAFVVDIGLPGMDGCELARELRRLPEGERVVLIALTGYGSPEEKERALEAGFDAHLTKPADIEQLHQLLSRTR
jgi:signal transduction histidine kinase